MPNNIWYVNANFVLINKIKKIENVPFFEGKIIINLQPLFKQPYNSSNFGIFKVDEILTDKSISFNLSNIKNKAKIYNNNTKHFCYFSFRVENKNMDFNTGAGKY